MFIMACDHNHHRARQTYNVPIVFVNQMTSFPKIYIIYGRDVLDAWLLVGRTHLDSLHYSVSMNIQMCNIDMTLRAIKGNNLR